MTRSGWERGQSDLEWKGGDGWGTKSQVQRGQVVFCCRMEATSQSIGCAKSPILHPAFWAEATAGEVLEL